LSSEDRERVLNESHSVLHCAACTSFDPRRDEEVWASNVDATDHMLALAEAAKLPYYHVSTAYVAGKRDGVAGEEELDCGQGFRNMYERSKWTAEGRVRQAFHSGRLEGAVFRPSIIVGAHENNRISQFLNFYGFLRLVDTLARGKFEAGNIVRLQGKEEVTKNLVPVDWIAASIWRLWEKEGASGRTYHLTNPNPPTQAAIMDWANRYLAEHDSPTRFAVVDRFDGDAAPVEEFVSDRLRHYADYLYQEPAYDRRNTKAVLNGDLPFPDFDDDYFSRLLYFAASRRWKDVFRAIKDKKDAFEAAAPPSEIVSG
jgi:nucleoside-diphosphate-sugar epimerase